MRCWTNKPTNALHCTQTTAWRIYHWAKDFAEHQSVAHTLGEYVTKDGTAHTQTVESFFALIKRQIYGTHHAVSEAHLQRYVTEAAFRWTHRIALGVNDNARAAAAIKAIGGKRLTYGTTRQAKDA